MFSRALQVASNKAASSVALVRKESFVVVQKRANSSDAFPDDMHDDNGYSEELPRQARGQICKYFVCFKKCYGLNFLTILHKISPKKLWSAYIIFRARQWLPRNLQTEQRHKQRRSVSVSLHAF
jgi:hypothetical protein